MHPLPPYPPTSWTPPSLAVPHCARLDCALTHLPPPPPQNPYCYLLPYPLYERGLGLNTILLLPILQGVWHTKGRSREGRILPNSRTIVLHQCGQCRRAGRMKGQSIPAQTTRSETISCKGLPFCKGGLRGLARPKPPPPESSFFRCARSAALSARVLTHRAESAACRHVVCCVVLFLLCVCVTCFSSCRGGLRARDSRRERGCVCVCVCVCVFVCRRVVCCVVLFLLCLCVSVSA